MDVRSLHKSIPNNESTVAIKNTTNYTKTGGTKIITTFLTLILTLNNFSLNSKLHLQTIGCTMGTNCAPSYENIFMENFENSSSYIR